MAAPKWTFSQNKIRFDFEKGGAVSPEIKQFTASHPADFDGEGDYESVFARLTLDYLPTTLTDDWLNVLSNIDGGSSFNLVNGANETISIGLDVPVNTFNASTRLCRMVFETIGLSNNVLTVLARDYVDVELYVSDNLNIEYSPALIELQHCKTTPIQTAKDFYISGINWTISYPSILDITTDSPNVTAPIGTTIKSRSGSGLANFKIKPAPFVEGQPIGFQNHAITITPSEQPMEIPVYLDIFEAGDYYGFPYSFLFETILNIKNANAQYLFISITDSFTIQKPAWLAVQPLTGNVGQNSLYVRPFVDENTVEGELTGEIVITTDNTLETYIIPVTHSIIEFVGEIGTLNYTKDNKLIEVFTEEENTYFSLVLTAKLFDRVTEQERQVILPYKLPLFQLKQSINIGLVMDRLIASYQLISLDTENYKSNKADIVIKEQKIQDEQLINSALLSNVKYIAGFTPHNSIDQCAILTRNKHPKRITSKSLSYLNLYLTVAVYELKIYQNNTLIDTINIDAFAYDLHSIQLDWSQYELVKGDVIEAKIEINPNEFLTEYFLVFPDNKQSQLIVWEDEYKMRQCLEFTGDYALQTSKEQITHKYQTDLLERLQKYRIDNTLKLSINTGWILNTDHITVENIIDSKKAWLILGLNKDVFVELVPIDGTINNIDSDRELISYEVEFEINKDSHAEIYNF